MRRRFPRQVLSFCVVELFLAVAESNTRAGPSATGAARSSRPRNAAKTSACRDDANGTNVQAPVSARLALVTCERRPEKREWVWSGRRESNPRMQLGKLPFCH